MENKTCEECGHVHEKGPWYTVMYSDYSWGMIHSSSAAQVVVVDERFMCKTAAQRYFAQKLLSVAN